MQTSNRLLERDHLSAKDRFLLLYDVSAGRLPGQGDVSTAARGVTPGARVSESVGRRPTPHPKKRPAKRVARSAACAIRSPQATATPPVSAPPASGPLSALPRAHRSA